MNNLTLVSKELVSRSAPVQVLAYDIECTKAPLKFPNVEIDQVRTYIARLFGCVWWGG